MSTADNPDHDRPHSTAAGNSFIVPAAWHTHTQGRLTLLTPPEAGSSIAIVELQADDADAAVAAAWATCDRTPAWPLKVVTPLNPRDGWTDRCAYHYRTSPNERRIVYADVRRANGTWTVALHDMSSDVAEKRGGQVSLVFGKLLPKGRTRESFARRRAHALDAARIDELCRFVETSLRLTGVPGASLGLVQHGESICTHGFGVRALGKPEAPDADTRYLVASNTKPMVTLMLARLVDQGKIDWDSRAIDLLPSFKLGDAATTQQVRVKHLIGACTGMPRQDLEWLLDFRDLTPERALTMLGEMQPTSGFGELFQYSNPLAAAGGYVGGRVVFPDLELGAAYDCAMQREVFAPLGMADTTHDFALAQRGNFAAPHAPDIDGKPAPAVDGINLSILPVRPSGGAWSTVHDLLKVVKMELAEGLLPNGERYLSSQALLARRQPMALVSADMTYGMGLLVDRRYGTPVVHHGGAMIGFHTDMMWLPEHGVGAVLLMNGDPGWLIHQAFLRKLLEVLFDAAPEADAQIAALAKFHFDALAANRKQLTVPAEADIAAQLARHYRHPAIGEVAVNRRANAVVFDFGLWHSEMASCRHADGTASLQTIAPGFMELEFVLGMQDGRRTLTLRDAQHEYVMVEAPRKGA